MMRLIDANELKEHLFVGADYDKAIDDGIAKSDDAVFAFQCGWNDALKSVAQFAPTVDAVPVVRCRDCKFYDKGDCNFWDDGYGAIVSADDYCSQGKKIAEDEVTDETD